MGFEKMGEIFWGHEAVLKIILIRKRLRITIEIISMRIQFSAQNVMQKVQEDFFQISLHLLPV